MRIETFLQFIMEEKMGKKEVREYKMIYDFHTHTIYSRHNHGRGTVRENTLEARKKGLEELAITDHGLGHYMYGIRMKDVPSLRYEINEVNAEFDDINVYLGIEANIIDSKTGLDMTSDQIRQFDFINAGYHFGVFNGHFLENRLCGIIGKSSKALIKKNTNMTIRALHENNIKILTHPGDKYEVDMAEVAKACEKTNTLMEISNWHANLTVEEMKIASKYDVRFVISSDAHSPIRVGTFDRGLARALEAGIDISRIDNIKKL